MDELTRIMSHYLHRLQFWRNILLIGKLLGMSVTVHNKQGTKYLVYKEHNFAFLNAGYPGHPLVARLLNSAARRVQGLSYGELGVVKTCVAPGDIVFDVGAHIGRWTKTVLESSTDVEVHLFEPVPQTYQVLVQDLAEAIGSGKVVPNNCGIAQQERTQDLFFYEDAISKSSFSRRWDLENQQGLKTPEVIPVGVTTLSSYCERLSINRINFLKVDVKGAELDVLEGARSLLEKGKIDYLQFEYGGTYQDAGITLQQVFQYLREMRYEVFRILPIGLEHRSQFLPRHEDFRYSNFLAVNERFQSNILGEPQGMLDIPRLCLQHSIIPRGVIHIGAHEGHEIEVYRKMGAQSMLFIEANPIVFERLKRNVVRIPNTQAVNYAISDQNGTVTLHVTSMDQASSILRLKLHKEIAPDIKETCQVTVQSRTLDTLLQELKLVPSDYNILNMDIQGAELLALKGATNTLKHIQAINTEVEYKELYEGAALIDQLDEFLDYHGFERVATTTPYHPSWGDAFYMRKSGMSRS